MMNFSASGRRDMVRTEIVRRGPGVFPIETSRHPLAEKAHESLGGAAVLRTSAITFPGLNVSDMPAKPPAAGHPATQVKPEGTGRYQEATCAPRRARARLIAFSLLRIAAFTLVGLACTAATTAQVLISLDLLPRDGAQLGRGVSAYAWNVHACGIGPTPVPWDIVRMNFSELRIYNTDQANAILATRVKRSLPAEILRWTGYGMAAVGFGVLATEKLNRSPSWLGPGIAVSGLAIPVVEATVTKDVPRFAIVNPPPEIISLATNACADYVALAAFGKAPVTIRVRRIDPVYGQEAPKP